MKIVVVGMGYVGLSISCLLAQKNKITGVEINKNKLEKLSNYLSPLKDEYIEKFIIKYKNNLFFSSSIPNNINDYDFVIISTPTNYDDRNNSFDTSSVESVLKQLSLLKCSISIVIKSTVPIGFSQKMAQKYRDLKIFFSPEFLREGKALEDNLYPSRIIVGLTNNSDDFNDKGLAFGQLLNESAVRKTNIIIMKSIEAEAVKLFANTYLASRVAFFNELDTYAETNDLDSSKIIHGVCSDPRIGDYYNNPSFGYGGYCLPKDSKQLFHEFRNIDNNLIEATVKSNSTRASFIANQIFKIATKNSKNPVIGFYRLAMKADSDNYRSSASFNVIDYLLKKGCKVVIFEPLYLEEQYHGAVIINSFNDFIKVSDLIAANRKDDLIIKAAKEKLYTRDIYGKN